MKEVKMQVAAIFAETPFQLIAALNVAYHYLHADGVVLFLTRDMFKTENKFEVDQGHPFIKGIYYMRRYGKPMSFAKKLFLWLKYGHVPGFAHVVEGDLPPRELKVASAIGMKYSVWIPNYLRFIQRKVPVYIVEEGAGDYCDGIITGRPIVADWYGEKDVIASIERMYMMPECYMKFNPGAMATKAPFISSPEFHVLLESLFFRYPQEEKGVVEKKRIMYFDRTVYYEGEILDEYRRLENEILQVLSGDETTREATAIKKHPRSMVDYAQYGEFPQLVSAWEYAISFLSPQELDNKIIIGYPTTIMITPKGLFNREPYIISLHRIFRQSVFVKVHDNPDIYTDYLDCLKKKYTNPEKVIFPETIEEFREVLCNLMKK